MVEKLDLESDEESVVVTMTIFPDDKTVDELFDSFSECSSMNPDDPSSDEQDEEFPIGEFITADNAEEALAMFESMQTEEVTKGMEKMKLEDNSEEEKQE